MANLLKLKQIEDGSKVKKIISFLNASGTSIDPTKVLTDIPKEDQSGSNYTLAEYLTKLNTDVASVVASQVTVEGKADSVITVTKEDNKYTVDHKEQTIEETAEDAISVVPGSEDGKFTITKVQYDNYGHITGVKTQDVTITIPEASVTVSDEIASYKGGAISADYLAKLTKAVYGKEQVWSDVPSTTVDYYKDGVKATVSVLDSVVNDAKLVKFLADKFYLTSTTDITSVDELLTADVSLKILANTELQGEIGLYSDAPEAYVFDNKIVTKKWVNDYVENYVITKVDDKQDAIYNGETPVAKYFDDEPTADSNKLVTSGNIKTYVDTKVDEGFKANDAMVLKGTIDGAGLITSPKDSNVDGKSIDAIIVANVGWTFKVSVAGTILGQKVAAGDMVICVDDTNYNKGTAPEGENLTSAWNIINVNIDETTYAKRDEVGYTVTAPVTIVETAVTESHKQNGLNAVIDADSYTTLYIGADIVAKLVEAANYNLIVNGISYPFTVVDKIDNYAVIILCSNTDLDVTTSVTSDLDLPFVIDNTDEIYLQYTRTLD